MNRFAIVFALASSTALSFPTVCSTIRNPFFEECLDVSMRQSWCGFPPRPCVHISYYRPNYFIEVVPNPQETFFRGLGMVAAQLAWSGDRIPYGAEDDHTAFSAHAHTLNIPFANVAFSQFSCGGNLEELPCLTSASEHLGHLWKTGIADRFQPKFLAWQLNPKACLVAGAAQSFNGIQNQNTYGYVPACSVNRSWMNVFPPSEHTICSPWGIHFPRSGTVQSSDQLTASLNIASRMRSLATDVFQSIPASGDEKWQMILPQPTSCFREGQNIGLLSAKLINESGRVWNGQPKKYLYAVWSRVGCTRDIPEIARTRAAILAARTVCAGRP